MESVNPQTADQIKALQENFDEKSEASRTAISNI